MRGRTLQQLIGFGLVAAASIQGVARAETLVDAWKLAEARDPRLAAAGADVDAARASERAARGARFPQLSVGGERMRFASDPALVLSTGGLTLNAPLLDGRDASMATATIQVPLYTGGRITGGIAAATASTVAADRGERAERAALRLDVAQAYVDVLRTRRQLEAAQNSMHSLESHAGDVDVQVERGQMPRSDALAARVALANAEQQQVRSANAVALATAAYNRRLGEPLEREPSLAESLTVDHALETLPLEQLLHRALDARPELAALDARARALDAQARATRGRMLPQLALSGSRTHLDTAVLDRSDYTWVGVGLTWNLFDGGQARNEGRAFRSASRAAELRLEDLRSQIALQVRAAWLGVREARVRAATAGQAVAQAEENLRTSRELYGAGLATNTQVLDAVSLESTARGNRDSAALDVELAALRLSYETGGL